MCSDAGNPNVVCTINNIKYNLHQVTLFLHCIGEMLSMSFGSPHHWWATSTHGHGRRVLLFGESWLPGRQPVPAARGQLCILVICAKEIAGLLCDRLKVKRCALISRPHTTSLFES